jgi:L-fuculose-phosphate aldolase
MIEEMQDTLWAAKELFDRQLVTGTTGNISFRKGDNIFITKSGSCFGLLSEDSFSIVEIRGKVISGKPSKEFPLHLSIYRNNPSVASVIHTHSFYCTEFSCLRNAEAEKSKLFAYTPYLKMKTNGKIGFVKYSRPGSEPLFLDFEKEAEKGFNSYILRNHGLIVGTENPITSFSLIEEFETSAHLAMELGNYQYTEFDTISYSE